MSDTVKALVAADEQSEREAVQELLSLEPGVRIVGLLDDLENGSNGHHEPSADLMVVACSGYSERALAFIDGSVRHRPERPVVVLCEGPANGFVRRVFEAGADDIVTLPDSAVARGDGTLSEQVVFTLQKAMARKNGSTTPTATDRGTMICVLGPKGGIGKTLTASNLAVSLADDGEKVVVVDLDLQFGDVGLALGLQPEKTIYDLAVSSGSLDAGKLDSYLATHKSGARALLAPTRPDHAGAITVEFLREVYAMLRSTYDYVIVDTPPGFTPEVIASIDSSSHVCMVGTLDSLSLKNTKLGLDTLELMGYERDRIRLVLNRADSRVGITRDDVLAVVGQAPDVMVPSHRDIARSVNEAAPIALSSRRSDAAKAFKALAGMFSANGSKEGN